MEQEHRKKLYIPYNLNFDTEYFTGFGKPELKQCAVGITGFGIAAQIEEMVSAAVDKLLVPAGSAYDSFDSAESDDSGKE